MPRNGPALRKLYYSIGEVARLTDVPAHVLRYWESEFPQLKPRKSATGSRQYQAKDIELVRRIRVLLYDQRFTIAGARAVLEKDHETRHLPNQSLLSEVREELKEILELLNNSGRGAAR